MGLRFHWRLLQGGDDLAGASPERVARQAALPDLEAQVAFSRQAEELGIDSFLVDVNYGKPDPMVLGLALAHETTRMKLMVAHRPGLVSPTLFVQQVNTFSLLSGGRITLNIVAGHSPAEQRYYGDTLSHDERYERMDEYLTVCRAFWQLGEGVSFSGKHYRIEDGRLNVPWDSSHGPHPEIYLGGSSAQAMEVASKHATCWLRFADTPKNVARQIRPVIELGKEVGLRLSVIVRATREEALEAAAGLVAAARAVSKAEDEKNFVRGSDSKSMQATYDLAAEDWLSPVLWAGAVRHYGATALALVGSPTEVASALMEYARAGVSQLILSGWPKREEMTRFGKWVIPIVREMEEEGRDHGRDMPGHGRREKAGAAFR